MVGVLLFSLTALLGAFPSPASAFRAGGLPVSFTRPLHSLGTQQGVSVVSVPPRRGRVLCSVEDKKGSGNININTNTNTNSAETEAARRERFRAMQEEAAHMFESRAQQLARQAQNARAAKEEQAHLLSTRGLAGIATTTTTANTQKTDKTATDEHQSNHSHDMHTVESVGGSPSLLGADVVMGTDYLPFQLRQAIARNNDVLRDSDISYLREKVLGLESFYVTGEERRCWPKALLLQGNVRGRQLEDSMTIIHERLRTAPNGIGERVSVFVIEIPPSSSLGQGDVPGAEPTLALLAAPASLSPDATPLGPAVAGACGVASSLSSLAFVYAAFVNNPMFFDKWVSLLDVPAVLSHCLPVVGGILAMQAVHEAAHHAVAKGWQLKLGLPFLLPSLELGIFGAITPLQSFPKSRKALFDVALAGPLVGLLLSIGLFILGLVLTPATFADPSDAAVLSGAAQVLGDIVSTAPPPDFPTLPLSLIHQSYLLSVLTHLSLPHLSLLDAAKDSVSLHPLALVGLCGVLSNAFNCMPVGRLDGGRAFTSAFGRNMAQRVAAMVLIGQALLCAVSFSGLPLLFVWGMLFNTLQRRADAPPMDDITEVDEGRQILLISSLFVVFLALIPYSG